MHRYRCTYEWMIYIDENLPAADGEPVLMEMDTRDEIRNTEASLLFMLIYKLISLNPKFF